MTAHNMEGEMQGNLPEIPDYLKEILSSGEIEDEISIDREGNWFHNREPFTNKKIIDFFNSSVNRTEQGTYVIAYDTYVYPIDVEDTAIFVTGVRIEGFGPFETISLNLSTGETEDLDHRTLYYRDNNALYCMVRNGSMPAKFRRSPSFHILERLEERDGNYFLSICGERILLEMRTTE